MKPDRAAVSPRHWLRTILIPLVGLSIAGDAGAADARAREMTLCGWFVNPTPANVWLVDRQAEWTISTQGGPEADGDWPRFKASQWVQTNGHYGHGCACMRVVADPDTHQVASITAAHARSPAVCRRDRSLKEPS